MSVERTVRVNLVASTNSYDASMARSGAVTAATSKQVGGLGKTAGGTMGMLSKFGPMLLGGAGLAKGFQATAGAAIEWESAMAGVQKTVDGTPAQLAAIGDGLRDLSKELPTSAEELAGIAESAGQLGIQTDNVLGFTKVIADLGETTNLVGQEGATQLARFANITQMSQGDFNRLGSTVVDLGNNFATTEAEIVGMGLRLAGSGAVIGLTEAEIFGLSTALTSLGINAEAGGTAFSKVMVDIGNAAASGGEELDAFAEVAGMSSDAFADLVETDPAQAIVALVEGLGNAAASGQNLFEVIEGIGVTEVRMRDALLRSAGAGDLLAEAIRTGNVAWDENSALTKEAELRYGTTAAKLDMLKNSVKDTSRELGQTMKPAIDGTIESLNALVTGTDEADERLRAFGSDLSVPERMVGLFRDLTLINFQQDLEETLSEASGLTTELALLEIQTQRLGTAADRTSSTPRGLGAAMREAAAPDAATGGGLWESAEAAEEAAEKWTDLAAEFLNANQAMDRANEENRGSAEAAAEAHNEAIDSQIEKLKKGETEQRKSLQEQKRTWEDYADDFPATIGQVTGHLEDVNQEFRDWRGDLEELSARAGGGVAERLAMMGPEWAPIVAEAVDATAEELVALDQAMVENISLQMAAAELAVQMQVMEEVARQGGDATVASVAEALGAAPEVVAGVFDAIGRPEIEVTASIDPALERFAEVHGISDELAQLVAIATVDANNEPALRSLMESIGLGHEWDEYTATAEANAEIEDVIAGFLEAKGLGDEWDEYSATGTMLVDDQATSILDSIKAKLDNIPREVVTSWRMRGMDVAGATGFGGVTVRHAGGMAGGGWRRYHAGGLAGDEIPAILQRGEYIVDKSTTKAAGGAAGIEQMLASNYAIGRGGGGSGGGMIRIEMPMSLDGRQIGSSWAVIDAMSGEVAGRGRDTAGAGL